MTIQEIKEIVAEAHMPDPEVVWDELRVKYQACFRQHPDVLVDMLIDLQHFDIATDVSHVILQRYATHLLKKLGVFEEEEAERKLVEYYLRASR